MSCRDGSCKKYETVSKLNVNANEEKNCRPFSGHGVHNSMT